MAKRKAQPLPRCRAVYYNNFTQCNRDAVLNGLCAMHQDWPKGIIRRILSHQNQIQRYKNILAELEKKKLLKKNELKDICLEMGVRIWE